MDTTRPAPRQPKHNVEVVDFTGTVIAGFWQCGTLNWAKFYSYLMLFVIAKVEWSIFQFDPVKQQPGPHCPRGPEIVQPGRYILLSTAGAPITVSVRPCDRVTTDTPNSEPDYSTRAYARDGKCLITGLESDSSSGRLKVTHIFPRVHDVEWVRKGYPSKITDTADLSSMGGPAKIDSIQNVITLRRDLSNAWENYQFCVDPNDNYRITAFASNCVDVDGLRLQLDHIDDANHRPLDELFTDHLIQGFLRYMNDPAELGWTCEDGDEVSGDDSFGALTPKN